MVLEAVMLCVDNSESGRNCDYAPSRFAAQQEACTLITSHKINANQETTVGLLTMSGSHIDVLVSPTRSIGAIQTALASQVRIKGHESRFAAAVKTAALALKNRPNKNQRQRIIVFVASPLEPLSLDELLKVGRQLKKNGVSIDCINYGLENTASNDNVERLEQFVQSVNNSDNTSHLLNVPVGPHHLSDMILNSPLLVDPEELQQRRARQEATAAGAGAGADAGGAADMGSVATRCQAAMLQMGPSARLSCFDLEC